MSAHNGSVNHHVFVVVIACQQLENALENPDIRPSAKALVHDLPVAETRGQITPRNTSSVSVENGFDEQPTVRRGATYMAFTAGQKIFDPCILVVSQSKTLHGSGLRKADLASITRQLIWEFPTDRRRYKIERCSAFDSDPLCVPNTSSGDAHLVPLALTERTC
jgi:hypothetical protein